MVKQVQVVRAADVAIPDAAVIVAGDATDAPAIPNASDSTPAGTANRGWRVLATLSALMAFASISTDLYLPAMPTMYRSLGASAGMMEWTVSGYLIGFSLGQLLWGPIGDRLGRRLPVAIGIVLFVIGSAGCALSDSAWMMIGWRVVQAVGACAGVVLSRAMVRDLYEGPRAAQMLSTLITVMAIAPLVGPVLGAEVLALVGWRAIFWLLVAVGILTLLAVITLEETLPIERRNRDPLGQVLIGYGALLGNGRLLGYVGAGGFFYGGIYAYIAGSPTAYISYLHVPPQLYGVLFSSGIVGIMLMNLANSRIVMRFSGDRLLVLGAGAAALSGIVLAAAGWTGWFGIWGLAIPLFVFVSANGFIVANSIAGALADFPERAGTVSALVGALQYGCGIVGSALVGAFADGTAWPMDWVIALAGVGSFACAWLIVRRDPAG